jgi:hypothetical protein
LGPKRGSPTPLKSPAAILWPLAPHAGRPSDHRPSGLRCAIATRSRLPDARQPAWEARGCAFTTLKPTPRASARTSRSVASARPSTIDHRPWQNVSWSAARKRGPPICDFSKKIFSARPLIDSGPSSQVQGTASARAGRPRRVFAANGRGVPQDYIEACKWFNLSAAQGNQDAVKSLGISANRMTSAQIAEAQKLAREWKPTKQPPSR